MPRTAADRYFALADCLEDFVICAPHSREDLAQALAASNALRWAALGLGVRDEARARARPERRPEIVGVEVEEAV